MNEDMSSRAITPNYDQAFDRKAETVCQHCGGEVTYARRPADADYAAFAHVATNTVACG